jgi:dTDP-3-amino-3,4,6-trideoxy-alpha-D-glucopyranose N,N-dimethyltransferase
MADYASFAAFYDAAHGDRASDIAQVRSCIERFMPSARSLLELGCGTGAVLADLATDMRVVGIDASPEMLAIAAENVGRAQLVEADMTAFSLDDQFDVVICIYNSINQSPVKL